MARRIVVAPACETEGNCTALFVGADGEAGENGVDHRLVGVLQISFRRIRIHRRQCAEFLRGKHQSGGIRLRTPRGLLNVIRRFALRGAQRFPDIIGWT